MTAGSNHFCDFWAHFLKCAFWLFQLNGPNWHSSPSKTVVLKRLWDTKHAIFKFYGSWLREAIKTTKLRVVAVTHGDDSQPFSCCQKKSNKKKLMDIAWTHEDDPKELLPGGMWKEKMEGCHGDKLKKILDARWPERKWRILRLESRWQQSVSLFWFLTLKLIQNLNIECFLAKTLKKSQQIFFRF